MTDRPGASACPESDRSIPAPGSDQSLSVPEREWPRACPDGDRLLAQLPRPRTGDPHRIAVLSDVHFSTTEARTSKQLHRTPTHLRAAVSDINRRDVDAVVCLGDLVHRGRSAEYDRVADRLDDLDPPLYAVPGNHDLSSYEGTDGLELTSFAERFGGGSYPLAAAVGELTVRGVPATAGSLDPATLATLRDRVSADDPTLLCLHYPTRPVVARLRRLVADPSVVQAKRIVRDFGSVVDQEALPLVLTGHLHVPLLARRHGRAYVGAPPLCTYPQGYLLVRTDPSGCQLRFAPVVDAETMAQTKTARARHSATDRTLTDAAAAVMGALSVVPTTGGG